MTVTEPTSIDQRKITNPEGLFNPVPHGYSFAVSTKGDLVFLAGHRAGDLRGNLISGDFAAQIDQAIQNLGISLAAEGLGYEHVVRLSAFVSTTS